MELELFALNFVRDNPFFKKDAEKRMSASFCGSMSLVSETVIADTVSINRRPLSTCGVRGMGVLSSSSRSKSAFSLVERPVQQQNLQQLQQPSTMVVEGTTVKLRRTDSTRRKEMTARRETVEILMEEIVRENRKSIAEVEAEEQAASSGSDLEYGPGIVERLKAKFAKISTGDSKKRQKHKRHHSVDDILEESVGGVGDYDTYDRRSCSSHGQPRHPLRLPERSTQTLDRSPRHSNNGPDLLRRASRSMADLAAEDYGERRAFSLQRPSRREEYEREQQERAEYRYEEEEDDDMVNISELRKMFDRPGGEEKRAPSWRAEASRHDRFIERGKTHAMVPPNVGDTRRDAPPPRELRLTAPGAAISIDNGGAADDSAFPVRAVPLKKTTTTITGRRASAFDEEDDESLPEFVKMARRLRRATLASAAEETHGAAAPKPTEPLAIVTSLPPADPAQDTVLLASPPAGRRDSFTGAVSDVSPPPEEPKPPMRPSDLDHLHSSTSSCNNLSEPGSRYSSLARSERSRTDSTSTHIPYSDLSLPRSDVSIASKASKRSVSTEGGVRMGYVAARSTSSERRSNGGYPQVTVPENQGTSGVEEMQRLLSRFGKRRPEERKEAPPTASPRDELLAAREAAKREEEKEEEEDRVAAAAARAAVAAAATVVVLSPGPERRTRFVPAIIGMRSSDGRQLLSPTMTTGASSRAESPSIAVELLHSTTPAVNVVSISVRDSAPSVIYTNAAASAAAAAYHPDYHTTTRRPCDDESEVRRSSVGSTASSSASSIADSLTSSGCSSSEDLAAECRPQSLLPPLTPPRKESLEDSTPKQSLSARYLQERGRDLIFTPRAHDSDNESSMDASSYEASYDLRDAAAAYNASKPYGDEVMATPPAATAAAPEVTAAPTVKVEEEEEHVEAAAAVACCLSQDQQEEKDTPSAHTSDLTPQVCDDERQDVSIVEIDEEEIMEDEAAPEARQQTKPEVHVQLDQAQYIAEPQMRRQPPYDDDSDSEVDTDDDGEIEDIANRHLRLCFNDMNSPQMAGDGNPIRHSIIHLAMEEDRPALLEAMSETYSFVFEDVDDAARASTSGSVAGGIIKPAHAERRAKMKRIVIESEATGVYTYLDEQSAETEEQWREGAAVTIQDYHSMVATAAAEAEAAYMRSVDELTRWNASIAASERAGSSSSSSDPISDLNSRHLVYST